MSLFEKICVNQLCLFSVDNEGVSVPQRTARATLASSSPSIFKINFLLASPWTFLCLAQSPALCWDDQGGNAMENISWAPGGLQGTDPTSSVQVQPVLLLLHCSSIPLLVASFRCIKCLWAHSKSMLEWQTVTADSHFLAIDPISSLVVDFKLSGILQH